MPDPAPEERAAMLAAWWAYLDTPRDNYWIDAFNAGWAAGRAYERKQIDRAEERQDATP